MWWLRNIDELYLQYIFFRMVHSVHDCLFWYCYSGQYDLLEVIFLEPFSVLTFSRYPVMFVMSEKYVTCRNIMHEFRRWRIEVDMMDMMDMMNDKISYIIHRSLWHYGFYFYLYWVFFNRLITFLNHMLLTYWIYHEAVSRIGYVMSFVYWYHDSSIVTIFVASFFCNNICKILIFLMISLNSHYMQILKLMIMLCFIPLRQ